MHIFLLNWFFFPYDFHFFTLLSSRSFRRLRHDRTSNASNDTVYYCLVQPDHPPFTATACFGATAINVAKTNPRRRRRSLIKRQKKNRPVTTRRFFCRKFSTASDNTRRHGEYLRATAGADRRTRACRDE